MEQDMQTLKDIKEGTYFAIESPSGNDKFEKYILIEKDRLFIEYILRLINVFREVTTNETIPKTKRPTVIVPPLLVDFNKYARELTELNNKIAKLQVEIAEPPIGLEPSALVKYREDLDAKNKLEQKYQSAAASLREEIKRIDFLLGKTVNFYEQVKQIYPNNPLIANDVVNIPFVNKIAIDMYYLRSANSPNRVEKLQDMRDNGATSVEKQDAAKLYLSGYHDAQKGSIKGAPAFTHVFKIVPPVELTKLGEKKVSGGKSIKSRKSRKSRKPKKHQKSRKPKKHQKSRKPKKHRKSRKSRKNRY